MNMFYRWIALICGNSIAVRNPSSGLINTAAKHVPLKPPLYARSVAAADILSFTLY